MGISAYCVFPAGRYHRGASLHLSCPCTSRLNHENSDRLSLHVPFDQSFFILFSHFPIKIENNNVKISIYCCYSFIALLLSLTMAHYNTRLVVEEIRRQQEEAEREAEAERAHQKYLRGIYATPHDLSVLNRGKNGRKLHLFLLKELNTLKYADPAGKWTYKKVCDLHEIPWMAKSWLKEQAAKEKASDLEAAKEFARIDPFDNSEDIEMAEAVATITTTTTTVTTFASGATSTKTSTVTRRVDARERFTASGTSVANPIAQQGSNEWKEWYASSRGTVNDF